MSITDVNPTFFKIIGKSNGTMASVPERTPAGATAQLTPGTKITIEDKDSYGGLKINISVDILEGDEVYSQYDLELVMRSNGNKQNTIEIQKSTKKVIFITMTRLKKTHKRSIINPPKKKDLQLWLWWL